MTLLRSTAIALALAAAPLSLHAAPAVPAVHDVDLAGIDHSVKPGDDFFKYANGTWIKSAQIPADRSSYGPGVILTEKTSAQVRTLIEDAAKGAPKKGSDAQKVGDFFGRLNDDHPGHEPSLIGNIRSKAPRILSSARAPAKISD